jgi:hypothetical protein
MKRWCPGDLVLVMLVRNVGQAEYYSNVRVMPMSEASWYERTWLWFFRSATVALELPALSIRLCDHGSLQFVACKLHRASTHAHRLVWEETHHPPIPNGTLISTSPLENICNLITPATCGKFDALIAPPR